MKLNYAPEILWPGVSLALCALHPIFILVTFISIYKYRISWATQISQEFSNYKWWYFGFPVFAFLIGYLNAFPFVQDDLMRHVVSHQFAYDYRTIYAHSSLLPSFNFWIGFEVFAGQFYQLLGPEYSVRAIQAIGAILFYVSLFFALNKILKPRADKWLWFTIIFTLCAGPLSRVFYGRPDIFFSAWLLSAVFLRPAIWLAIGIALSPTYAFGILYAPAAILIDTSWRNKIICGALFALSCVIFWYFYTNGEWLHISELVSTLTKNRTVEIAELGNGAMIIMSKFVCALLIMLFYFLYKATFKLNPQALPFFLLLAYFLLPNYIRFILPIVTLLALLCAIYIPQNIKINAGWSLLIFVFASLSISKAIPHMSYNKLPKFKIPENAVVLTQFDEGIYSAILHNPHVKFSPAMDIGFTDKPVQDLISNMHIKNTLNCDQLKRFSFTHIQENVLHNIPPCLRLYQIDGDWRLWEIK